MNFKLTNNQRLCLGLKPILQGWEKVRYNDSLYLYFEGDGIKKGITVTDNTYHEYELDYATSNNRTILLPKTNKGKSKKITPSVISNLNPTGTYFYFDEDITIANYTNQRTYYSTYYLNKNYTSFQQLNEWLNKWCINMSSKDIGEITTFSNSPKIHQKFNEGDFFRLKIDKDKYCFGRILLNADKFRKQSKEENLGLNNLMGKPIAAKIYHVISNDKDIDVYYLKSLNALPSQYIMDNVFYYGDCEIIENLPLEKSELDFPIQYGRSLGYGQEDIIYFQCGKISKISTTTKMKEFIESRNSSLKTVNSFFAMNGIGWSFGFNIDILNACINENSNMPYWNSDFHCNIKQDLRNPMFAEQTEDVFEFFEINMHCK